MFYFSIFVITLFLLLVRQFSKNYFVINLLWKENKDYDEDAYKGLLFVGVGIVGFLSLVYLSICWQDASEIEDHKYRDFLEAEWSTEVIKKNKFMEDGKITGAEYSEIMSHAPKWRDHVKLKVKE